MCIRIPCAPFLLFAGLCTLLLVSTGCRRQEAPPAAVEVAAEGQPDGRLAAALKITDSIRRDAVLSAFAKSAAERGDAANAKTAITAIGDTIIRNEVAKVCALTLAKAEKPNEATEIALLIRDSIIRDDTLSKIAGK